MQIVKDHFGTEVFIGDAILHYVKNSCDVDIHYSIVYGFIWRGNNTFEAKVVSVRKHYYKNEYIYYRATLTANNFVKVSLSDVPVALRKGLLDKIKR